MTRPRGVRSRLLVTVVVSVAVALALMTVGFNVLLARSLSRDADSVVRTRAATEAASVDLANDRLVAPDQPDSGGLVTQAWVFKDGRALEAPRVSAALDRAAVGAAATPEVAVDVPGLDTRLYAMPASDYPSIIVVAGVSLAPYRHTQRIALIGSLVFAGLLLLVVALIARWMLRAALRPVSRMTADAEAWSEHELDRRFAAGEPYDELSQLAATLDRLLDRLSASLRREQRFSAEVSHELRTPLAKVQAEAELALRRERQPAEYRAALHDGPAQHALDECRHRDPRRRRATGERPGPRPQRRERGDRRGRGDLREAGGGQRGAHRHGRTSGPAGGRRGARGRRAHPPAAGGQRLPIGGHQR